MSTSRSSHSMTNLLHQKFLAIEKKLDPYSNEDSFTVNDEVKSLLERKIELEEKIKRTELQERSQLLANQQIDILKNEIKQLEKTRSQQKFAGFLFSDNFQKKAAQKEALLLKKKKLEEEVHAYSTEYDKTQDYKSELEKLETEVKQLLKRRRFLHDQAKEKAAILVELQTQIEKHKSLKNRLSHEIKELTHNNEKLINDLQKNIQFLNPTPAKKAEGDVSLPTLPSNSIVKTNNLRTLYYHSRFLYNFMNKTKDDFEKIVRTFEFENQSNLTISFNEKKMLLTFSVDSISLEKEIVDDFFKNKSHLLRRNSIRNNVRFEFTPNKLVKSLNWAINVSDVTDRATTKLHQLNGVSAP